MKSLTPLILRNRFTLFLLTVLLNLGYVTATAQNILNNAGLSISSAAAYSTRKLSTSYSGYAMRVRRSSDNVLADIAFDASGQVSATSVATQVVGGATSSFSAFYGANSCFVTIWYDQSGNARHATQPTAANQPAIVNAGVPFTFNGKQGLYFNGATSVFTVPFSATVINAQGSFSAVLAQPVLQQNFPAVISWGSALGPAFGPLDDAAAGKFGLYTSYGPYNITLGPISANTNYVLSATWTGTAVTESRNKTVITGTLGAAFNTTLATGTIGRDSPGDPNTFNGTLPELIIFSTALTTTNRQALENNQSAYYIPATGLQFDGVNDFLSTGITLPTSYTKEAWINLNNLSLNNNIISGGSDGQHAFYPPAVYGNRLSAGHNGTWNHVQDPTPLAAGTWYHVAVTYDAATTTMKLYKNGVLVSTNTGVPPVSGGNAVRIGAFDPAANLFSGSMDEVRIWNRALVQSEIQNNMNCETSLTGQTGLLALYHFNQGYLNSDNSTVTTAADASGNNYTATLNNFALTGISSNWVGGNAIGNCPSPASALHFDGTNDYVEGTNASLPLGNSPRTVEAWFRTSSAANASIVNYGTDVTNQRFGIIIISGVLYIVGENNDFTTSSPVVTDGVWHHAAVSFDGTTIQTYLDGVSVGSAAKTYNTTGTTFRIGLRMGGGELFTGNIDEVRIWNRALCQSEIQNNRLNTLNHVGQTGLRALYHFNQGSSNLNNAGITQLIDATGNGHGTLYNFGLTGATSNWLNNAFVSGTAPVYVPSTLAGTAGGGQVCQSSLVQSPGIYYLDGSCRAIARIVPSGGTPVAGNVNTCVKIDATVQTHNGKPYVQRHYDITPASGAATATGTITLYYTQAEFDAYNTVRGTNPALPTGSADAAGIANLRITQYHGTGTAPNNYTGTGVLINPADASIVWNSGAAWWEVTFAVNGFSGFFVHTTNSGFTLPVRLLSFTGKNNGGNNLLQWKTENETNTKEFSVERSTDGRSFTHIATVNAAGTGQGSYVYTDSLLSLTEVVYYRLKMIDTDDRFTYSNVIRFTKKQQDNISIYPNPVKDQATLQVSDKALIGTTAKIVDVNGSTMQTFTITSNFVIVDTRKLTAGFYLLQTNNGISQKIIKQ